MCTWPQMFKPRPTWRGTPCFFATSISFGNCTLIAGHADAAAVDQRRADHDAAQAVLRGGEHLVVDRDTHRLLGLGVNGVSSSNVSSLASPLS